MTSPDPAQVVVQEILGVCRCHEAYTTRKMIDPGCAWHEYHLEIEEALTTFAAQQIAEATATLRLALDNANQLIGANADECEQAVTEARRQTWEAALTLHTERCSECGELGLEEPDYLCPEGKEFRRRAGGQDA